MLNIKQLIKGLPWKERKYFTKAWLREKIDFEPGVIMVSNTIGIFGGYRLGDGSYHKNTITLEGQLYLLATGLAGSTAEAAWYQPLWNEPTTPLESWTAAAFATDASEIISQSEGYSGADRPVWVPNQPLAEPMNSTDSPATYDIVTASSLSIVGTGLISSQARGATSGILMSAVAFDGGARTQLNGDTFKSAYEEGLQPV